MIMHAPAHKHDPQPLHPRDGGGGTGFTRFKTFHELFEPYPHLADCEAKFDAEKITPELVTSCARKSLFLLKDFKPT